MHAFKDAKDKPWEIVIDPYTIEKVRGQLGVNLYDLGAAIETLFTDPPKFVHALYLLCDDQTGEGKVSEREFCKNMLGDSLTKAQEAFIEEMIFFSPTAAKETLRRATGLQKELAQKTAAKLEERAKAKLAVLDLEQMAEKIADKIEREGIESR